MWQTLIQTRTKWVVGFVQAASFGGTNIDPTAWEDKKCIGESRFPAQVSSPVQFYLYTHGSIILLGFNIFVKAYEFPYMMFTGTSDY